MSSMHDVDVDRSLQTLHESDLDPANIDAIQEPFTDLPPPRMMS